MARKVVKKRLYGSKVKVKSIGERHSVRQKRRRRKIRARKSFLLLITLVIGVLCLMFLTPVFNITGIEVIGNNKILREDIVIRSEVELEDNLFKVDIEQVKKNLTAIPYLDKVHIKRVIYPPSIRIEVSECDISAYISIEDRYLALDKHTKVLEELLEPPEQVPEIVGLDNQKYVLGEQLEIDESDKFDIILMCIEMVQKNDYLMSIQKISVEDTGKIWWTYDNRLKVIFGSNLDLERKIHLFEEIIHSARMNENSRGTLDFSIMLGKAVHTP